jgi:hypothetical protein
VDQDVRAGSGAGRRRVRIGYVEPEFQSRNPDSPAVFSCTFEYPLTLSREEALKRALEEWDFCLRNTGVGWRRVIVAMSVDPGN